ncbi:MAG: hypothetical protein FJ272_02060 [Planctomycetes bacterium]|nr:hypothetical protein [Planctomycetota bacterium]
MTWGELPPFKKASMPAFPGLWKALGPAIVWMALAQGSGELIWWPYIIARYGLGFLFLLIPACLLQYPLNYEIGRYTLLTGESIFQGFIRLNRWLALVLWVLMTLSFLWFGAFATAGATAIAALVDFPPGMTDRGRTLLWASATILVFFGALLFSRAIYRLIEKIMWVVAVVTVAGFIFACAHPQVLSQVPAFAKGLVCPDFPADRKWDAGDSTRLLTAITFAGLGGFWTLFYSYWLREKGVGMAGHFGHITSPITGKPEHIPESGFTFEGADEELGRFRQWRGFLRVEAGVGIIGNVFTTLLICLLAYTWLFPAGEKLVPKEYQIAVVQSTFFEQCWGTAGRILFLVIAAAFLCDTWLATLDAVSRVHTDFVCSFIPRARSIPVRTWYYLFAVLLTVITSITMFFDQPGNLILLSAVIGFVGTVIFTTAFIFLNHFFLPPHLPPAARPSRRSLIAISLSCVAYFLLAAAYLYVKFGPK